MTDPNTTGKRPTLLTVLCILSFVWTGFSIIGGGVGYVGLKMISSGTLEEMVAQTGDQNALKQLEDAQAKLAETGLTAAQLENLTLIGVALSVVALIGVVMMWRLKRKGFLVYAIAQVASIISPLLLGGKLDMSASGIFFMGLTVLFVILYGTQTKHMH